MSIAEQLFIDSLRRSQWLPPDALERYQRPLLERLLRHAATQTAFYPDRLKPLFAGGDPAIAPLDLSQWNTVPIFTREDASELYEQIKARAVPPEFGSIRVGQSSGTTGRPLKHLRSELADIAANCILDRVYEVFGVDMFGSLAFLTFDAEQLHPYPHGTTLNGWNRTSRTGKFFVLDFGISATQQLEWLERVRPDHVMTYPINLRELAETALACASSNLKFKTFISTGEVLDPEAKDLIVRAFGCRVIDVYGAREIGQIAFQCPDGKGYHFCSEAVVCEILDDAGEPVRPGEYGRVVVTPLYNYAMPFIRYELGDYARVGATPCGCGRGLPTVDEIAGRTRNLYFIMPDGSRKRMRVGVWSLFLSQHFSFKQVQYLQPDINTLEIWYVPTVHTSTFDEAKIATKLRMVFHSDLQVRFVPVDRIERSAGHKFEQFKSLVLAT